jgi:hypothetical protein
MIPPVPVALSKKCTNYFLLIPALSPFNELFSHITTQGFTNVAPSKLVA